jgi:hypothetical protein
VSAEIHNQVKHSRQSSNRAARNYEKKIEELGKDNVPPQRRKRKSTDDEDGGFEGTNTNLNAMGGLATPSSGQVMLATPTQSTGGRNKV